MGKQHAFGSKLSLSLAVAVSAVLTACGGSGFVYNEEDSIETKLNKIVTKVYGGKGVRLTPAAKRELKQLEELGFSNYPICMAKTQYSFSDDAKKLGAPKDFVVTISQLKVSAGAGFIVASVDRKSVV